MASRYHRRNARLLDPGPFLNQKGHEQLHAPKTIVYTSTATLSTTAGSKLRLPRGGSITRIAAVVQGTPSGAALDFDLYIDGFVVTDSPVQIAVGDTISKPRIITRPDFDENSTMYLKINTVSSATGPLVVTIEYIEAW